jgi:drug/metabolite transporter (DMT)-like permease
MSTDRPLLGFAFAFAFCLLAPLGDALVKVVGHEAPLMVLLLSRFVAQALFLAPIVVLTSRLFRTSQRIFTLLVVRSFMHILGIGMMYISLRLLPLADAIAIVFIFPFILLVLGHFILGEKVGRQRIIACFIGFAGTLLVIQPSFVEIGVAALLPVLVAFAFSIFMLITRSLAKDYDPISMQATSGSISSLILLTIWLIAGNDFSYDMSIILPTSTHIAWLLLAIGILGSVSHLFMTIALRFAPSATIAPLQYVEIPIAAFLGWLLFSELPDGLAAIGIMITIGAGIFVLMNERKINRAAQV